MATWEERTRNILSGVAKNLAGKVDLTITDKGLVKDPRSSLKPNEGIIPYIGRRIGERANDFAAPIKEGASAAGEFLFGSTPVESKDNSILPSSAEEAARRQRMPMVNTVTRPEGTATIQPGTGVATSESGNSKELIGQYPQSIATVANRISPENPYGADVVNMPAGRMQVGARTDAEAARNLQDRAAQDQATQAEVARLNRATDAMQSLREARSPKFSFGASSIGGGPDTLDVASGRVINRDTPASVVASRMQDAVSTARRFGGFGGGKTGRLIAEEMGKVYLADKALQQSELEAGVKNNQAVAASNADMNKFLVGQQNFAQQQNMEKAKLNMEQQKFEQQQGLDKERLTVEKDALRNKQESTALGRQKYIDTQQKEFMNNYIAPEGAPADELKSGILAMSKATGLSPDIMNTYVQRVAKANNVDWKNAPPKNLELLFKQATALAASENK